MTERSRLHIFQAFGVEMEYMIVDKNTLSILPIADRLLHEVSGEYVSDAVFGQMTWSNELVNHVIELKVSAPAPSLSHLSDLFHEQVTRINKILEQFGAMLLPTGAHPFMDPFTETVLWPHEYNEIYALYNRIFDCRGHGWSNLQSTHLNLPFANDQEFARLHAAIRLLLPIIPAISASTPMLDGKLTGFADSRLEVYRSNQRFIPSITGKVIPEQAFSEEEYHAKIFRKIFHDIEPYDQDGILQHQFLNSRGAIARFDRGAIEIRLIDLQECPSADISILQGVTSVLKALVEQNQEPTVLNMQQSWHEERLLPILLETIKYGSQARITDEAYLKVFQYPEKEASTIQLWNYLHEKYVCTDTIADVPSVANLKKILEHGNLSERITQAIHQANTYHNQAVHQSVRTVYSRLADALAQNNLFIPIN